VKGHVRIMMLVAGILSWVGYSLGRYRAFGVPLDVVAIVGSLAVTPWMVWDGWRYGYDWSHVLIVLLSLLVFVALLLLRRKQYVVFRLTPFTIPPGVRELAPEEQVRARVTGYLGVQGQRHHFAGVPALFQTTELRDHIVMAEFPARRSLGAVRPEAGARGWWYAFISPKKVRSIQWARLFHGFARRQVIRVRYSMEGGKENTLFLGFDAPEDFALIARELCSRSGIMGSPNAT